MQSGIQGLGDKMSPRLAICFAAAFIAAVVAGQLGWFGATEYTPAQTDRMQAMRTELTKKPPAPGSIAEYDDGGLRVVASFRRGSDLVTFRNLHATGEPYSGISEVTGYRHLMSIKRFIEPGQPGHAELAVKILSRL